MLFFDERYHTFHAFSLAHLIPVLIIVILIILIFRFHTRLHESRRLDRFLRYGAAFAMIGMEWIFYAWNLFGGNANLGLLPFGLCAISMYLTAITLISDNEKLFKVVFPWALAGSLLSLVVADQGYVFPHFRYLHYFGNHGMFLVANIYLAIVKGYRFTYRDLLKSSLILLILSAAMYFINQMLGTNHMYLSELPGEVAFMFDWMGPRLWMYGFGFAIFILFHIVTFPFIRWSKNHQKSSQRIELSE
jgi:hypothetical integral membrane protein (TIGR02206 family)